MARRRLLGDDLWAGYLEPRPTNGRSRVSIRSVQANWRGHAQAPVRLPEAERRRYRASRGGPARAIGVHAELAARPAPAHSGRTERGRGARREVAPPRPCRYRFMAHRRTASGLMSVPDSLSSRRARAARRSRAPSLTLIEALARSDLPCSRTRRPLHNSAQCGGSPSSFDKLRMRATERLPRPGFRCTAHLDGMPKPDRRRDALKSRACATSLPKDGPQSGRSGRCGGRV